MKKFTFEFLMLSPGGGGSKRSSIRAFTLAEVLITLGIIGIVAAMTLPSLIANYQKKALKSQYKVMHSLLSEALNKAKSDFGTEPICHYHTYVEPHRCAEWDKTTGNCIKYVLVSNGAPIPANINGDFTDCIAFNKVFLQQFKIVKTCTDNAYAKGCIPKYEGNDTIFKKNNPDASDLEVKKSSSGLPTYRQVGILNWSTAYVLSNGQILLGYGNPFRVSFFTIDVNGKKGPNKWGYDVFGVKLVGDAHNLSVHFICTNGAGTEQGGVDCSEMLK